MTNPFQRLRNAYAILLGDRLCPVVGQYPLGAIVPVLPDAASARAWIQEFSDELEARDRGKASIVAVDDPWKFMRRAAAEGLAGIEGAVSEKFSDRFMFMVRVEEAGAELPTVLASITDEGWGACLTRSGEQTLEHAEVLHWSRFDILDRVTGELGLLCPFREWDLGDPLYELAAEGEVILRADVPIMGDWNSTDGAFMFFTSEDRARDYLRFSLSAERHGFLSFGSPRMRGQDGAAAAIRPRQVNDLQARLGELEQLMPMAAWCINPGAGCGSLSEPDGMAKGGGAGLHHGTRWV